ncbi:hypothetical protein DL98DRAFT_591065 [Cadophora sp. DSE1049]|nr:hypothetical protein DL98DRAFT_591065 [Cadophora sp. DSE1049]
MQVAALHFDVDPIHQTTTDQAPTTSWRHDPSIRPTKARWRQIASPPSSPGSRPLSPTPLPLTQRPPRTAHFPKRFVAVSTFTSTPKHAVTSVEQVVAAPGASEKADASAANIQHQTASEPMEEDQSVDGNIGGTSDGDNCTMRSFFGLWWDLILVFTSLGFCSSAPVEQRFWFSQLAISLQ